MAKTISKGKKKNTKELSKKNLLTILIIAAVVVASYFVLNENLAANVANKKENKPDTLDKDLLSGLKVITQVKVAGERAIPLNDIGISAWSESKNTYVHDGKTRGCNYLSKKQQKIPYGGMLNLNYASPWHYSGIWKFKTGAKYTYNKQSYTNKTGELYLGDGRNDTAKSGGMGFAVPSRECSPINIRVDASAKNNRTIKSIKKGKWVATVSGLSVRDKVVSNNGSSVSINYNAYVTPVVTFTYVEEKTNETKPAPKPIPKNQPIPKS